MLSRVISKVLVGIALTISYGSASAAFINGDIAFGTAPGASLTFTEGDLTTTTTIDLADGIKFNPNINGDDGQVTLVNGDYSAVDIFAPTYVDFNDFVFDPLTPGTNIWTFDSGGSTYSFSMSTVDIIAQTSSTITLEGTGIASITGFTNTPGEFSLTLNQNGDVTSFSSSASVVPVPAAVWLFGSGLLGLVGIARRKSA